MPQRLFWIGVIAATLPCAAQESSLDPLNPTGEAASIAALHGWDLEVKLAFKGGKPAPKVDFDAAKAIRSYLERRVPKAAGKETIIETISLEGCYAVPTGKTGGQTDPRIQAAPEARDAGARTVRGGQLEPIPDRGWKPLNKKGVAIFAAYPDPSLLGPTGRVPPGGTPKGTFIFLIDMKGQVFGVVKPWDFSARKPGTQDDQPDDGQLDPFAPR